MPLPLKTGGQARHEPGCGHPVRRTDKREKEDTAHWQRWCRTLARGEKLDLPPMSDRPQR
jgi:hypothetical protein